MQDWFIIFQPVTPASAYMEAAYSTIWERIGSAGLPGPGFGNTVLLNSLLDNGAGLQWSRVIGGNQKQVLADFIAFGATVDVNPDLTPSLLLTKTVGLGADCTVSPTVKLPSSGGLVTYCYTVVNPNYAVTLTTHSLYDSALGSLLTDYEFPLAAGASHVVTQSTYVSTTVTNFATWTASGFVGTTPVTATAAATATVTVNRPPVANDDIAAVERDSELNAILVLANDTAAGDVGETLGLVAVGAPSQGGSTVISGTIVLYSPAPSFVGTETFTYTISDGWGGYTAAAVTVQVGGTLVTPTVTPMPTITPTGTPTATVPPTPTPAATGTGEPPTPTRTPTNAPTATPSHTPLPTNTPAPVATGTGEPATPTPTLTATPTSLPSGTLPTIFWINNTARAIQKSADGGTYSNLLPLDAYQGSYDIRVDKANGKIYWPERGVKRANLDGTGVETLATTLNSIGLVFPDAANGGEITANLGVNAMQEDKPVAETPPPVEEAAPSLNEAPPDLPQTTGASIFLPLVTR